MISYCLNKEINGQKLLEDIQKIVTNKISETQDPASLVLVIDVKQISQTTTEHIIKIEHKTT
jgi:hypothetical protein